MEVFNFFLFSPFFSFLLLSSCNTSCILVKLVLPLYIIFFPTSTPLVRFHSLFLFIYLFSRYLLIIFSVMQCLASRTQMFRASSRGVLWKERMEILKILRPPAENCLRTRAMSILAYSCISNSKNRDVLILEFS